jgi:hypothetical protein
MSVKLIRLSMTTVVLITFLFFGMNLCAQSAAPADLLMPSLHRSLGG